MSKAARIIGVFLAVWVGMIFLPTMGRAEGKGDPTAGEALHKKNCGTCHGDMGKGDGKAAVRLKEKPKDWTDPQAMAGYKDQDLFDITAKGGGAVGKSKAMPAYEKKLKENEIWDLVAYVRSLAKK